MGHSMKSLHAGKELTALFLSLRKRTDAIVCLFLAVSLLRLSTEAWQDSITW
uniref:Uncharacterized protein n=1 Tax=Solanum lycopersicum TaxID=4081 RepID=A0A3Q7FM09_SOLLC